MNFIDGQVGAYTARFGACILAGLAVTAISSASMAEVVDPTLAGGSGSQCAYAKTIESPLRSEILDGLLVPGKAFDVMAVMREPRFAAFLSERGLQDQARKAADWGGLCIYKAANAGQVGKPAPRVVFMGDSITENWLLGDPSLFSEKIIDRGVSGQTSSQILLRFYPDVIALHPAVVHLMAGTNDVAQNTGPISDEDYLDNMRAMIDLAKSNHVEVVLSSILPTQFKSLPQLGAVRRIAYLNGQLRKIATERKITFVDYYALFSDGQGGSRAELSNDGVHPNRKGYALMRPLAEEAISQALGRR